MFIAALFTVEKTWKQTVSVWMDKLLYLFININICDTYKFDIFIYEYYPAIKRKFLK